MKKKVIILLFSIIILNYGMLSASASNEAEKNFEHDVTPVSRTDGEVDFQIRTLSYNGAYAPAHCLAIWICDENDNFVRTLVRRAWSYMQHLVKWNQMTGGDYTNAIITGASPNVHTIWNINWDCMDRFDEMIPDGTYRIYTEFTEDNSLLIPVNGPWTMVEFTKGDQPQTISPAGNQFFQDVSLEYNPSGHSYPNVEITSPSEGQEITELPFAILFELQNFSPDIGSLNLFINDEYVLQHAGEAGIPIYALPAGEVELTLKLLGNQGQPFDPPAEDSINILYNPANSSQTDLHSLITTLDNYPNPFNPTTDIRYSLSKASKVQIDIYNLKGQNVKTLVSQNQEAGEHYVTWNGTDKTGSSVPSGIYLYKLQTDTEIQIKKCILIK